jgi:uncharacterized repeat protein (TIGR03803 family)
MDASGNVTVLHLFSGPDGDNPNGIIQASDGNFYGTTSLGGAFTNCGNNAGCGTVFKIDASGNVTLLHAFSGPDGWTPTSSLIQASDGDFYGTTSGGGPSGKGTVFKMDALGNVTVLWSFSGSDGADPVAGLIQGTDGNLYGTTEVGGSVGAGVVFRLELPLPTSP